MFAKHTETCDDFTTRGRAAAGRWTSTNLAMGGLKASLVDKDENLRVSAGLFVHGGDRGDVFARGENTPPTVVYENLTVPKLGEARAREPGRPRRRAGMHGMCVSHPVAGKHVAFDERFLHGVVQEERASRTRRIAPRMFGTEEAGPPRTEAGPSGRHRKLDEGSVDEPPPSRVTFLVNVWLNHRPKGVKPLPDRVAGALRGVTSKPAAKAAAGHPSSPTL